MFGGGSALSVDCRVVGGRTLVSEEALIDGGDGVALDAGDGDEIAR